MSTALLDAFTQQLRDFYYDPVTNWSRFFNITPAMSLFTYNAGDQAVEQQVIDRVGSYGSQLSRILKMLDLLNQHSKLTGLDKSDQKVLDNFNELFRNSRAAVAKHKGELGEGDEMMVAAYLKKAAKGQFGDKIFNELKGIFTKSSNGNGETRQITPRARQLGHANRQKTRAFKS
jgi:hypothetical protein